MAVLALLDVCAPAMLGAVPLQGGVSPRPHNADYFSDRIYLGPDPAPRGAQVLSCVDDCSVFKTEIKDLSSDGDYDLLAIYPKDQSLRVRPDQLLPGKPVWSNQGS
jgi:hypothetical protein